MKIIIFTLIVISIFSSCTSNNSVVSVDSSINSNFIAEKQMMLNIINKARVEGAKCSQPVAPLNWNNYLASAAVNHSSDMAISTFFSHGGSGNVVDVAKSNLNSKSTFIDRIKYFGYPTRPGMLVGENITVVYSSERLKNKKSEDYFKEAIKHWLDDPVHCNVLMNSRFSNVGIAYTKGKEKYYFTAVFAEKIKP